MVYNKVDSVPGGNCHGVRNLPVSLCVGDADPSECIRISQRQGVYRSEVPSLQSRRSWTTPYW